MKRRAFTLALIVAAWSLSTPRVSLAQDPRLEYLNPLSEIYGESHVDLLVPGTIVLRFDQFPAGLLAGTQPINFGIPDLDALVPEFGVTAATPLSGILPGQQLGPVDVSMIFEIEFDETHDPLEVARRFDAADGVAYAEPVFEQLELATPNDPNFLAGNQSSLQLIGCEDAWEFAKGAGVVACSVESFDCEHEDLEDSLHAGGGRCGINGHGTAVAGLIAATTDNALGGAGIGWESLMYSGWLGSCMAEGGRVLNHSVVTTGSRAYQELINEAELRGLVPVISAANWDASRRNPSPPLRNVLVVAATNGTPSGGGPTDGRAVFTAFGELVDIAAPGAGGGRQTTVPQVCTSGQDAGDRCVTDDDCDGDCRLIGGSLKCFGGPNAGDACVDDDDCEANCAVPPYNGFSGTSASGPMASGVVALVAGMHPDWTGREIINHIKGTAEPIYGIPYNRSRYNLLGTGRLDAADAIGDDANPDNDYESMPSLQYVSVAVDDTPDPSKPWLVGDGDGSADAGEVVELVVHLINRYGASNDVEAILTTSAPGLATVRTDLFTSPVLYDAFGPLSSCNVACDNHRRNTAEPFVVEIDASASTHLNIPFSLQLTETSVDPYTTDLVFNLRSNTSAEVVRGAYPIHLLDGEHARFVSATPKQADLDGDTLPDLLQAEYDLPSNWSGIPVFVRAHDANGSQVFDQVAIEALIREPLAVGDLGATLGGGKMIAFAEVDLPAVGAIRPDGTSLFRHEIPNTSSRFSSPALGDIDGDGENEVIAVLSGIIGAAAYEDPAVYAFEANGAMLSGFPVVIDGLSQKAPPALGDLDNDGLPEIVVSTVDSEILVVDGTGFIGPEWPVDLADGALGAPVLGDLDGENGLDIVVAGKHSVHALTSDGTLRPGFPILMDAALEFDTQLSPLALGDIEDDGTLEIALTRRQLYLVGPFGRHLRNDVFLLGLDATGAGEIRMGPATISEDGTIGAQYHPVDWRYASSPTLADVDDDGTLELLVSEVRGLHVLNADGTDYSSAELSSPIPLIEQVQVGTNPHGFSHRYENLYGVERSPKFLAPPSATDIDGDDTVELAMASRSKRSHLLRTGLPPGRMPWNEVRGDSENTAALPSSSCPVATITSLSPSVGSNLTDVDVTITGTGFRSTVEVHLGDIRVPAVHVSSTTIVMTVPSGFMEGLHDLRLEFAEIDGCSIRASRADAYESLPDFQPPVLIPDVYVSTASDDRVKHFNLAVPVVSGAISVGDNPSRIDMSADGRFVYALNTDSQDVSMIRTADNLEIDTSPLPGFQRLPAGVFSFGLRVSDVAGVGSLIGTVSAGTSTLTVIDEASAADPTTPPVVATLSLPIPNAFDLAFDREGQGLIFITSAGAGELAVVDASAFPALSLVDVHAFSAIGGLGRVLTTPGGEFLFTCSISVNRMNRIDLTTAPPTLESRTITPGHDLFSGELTLYAEAERVFASGGLNRVQQASVEPYFVVPRTVPGSGVLHGGDELGPDGRIQLFASPIGLVQQLDMENLSGGPIQTIFMPGGPSDVAVGPTSEGPLILSLEPDSRAANCPSQSVLRGAFFQPGARVWVGDVECTVRFVSHTYLELTIPDGLPDGTYDVTVRNPDGQSETLPAGYTVDSSLTPTPEVRVNAATAGTQTALGIATTASEDPALAGRHAVLYFDASTGDYDTWLKVYDRDGTVVVPDTKVNPDPGLGSGGGDLTIDGDGRVTVVWSESYLDGLGEYRQDVFLKRYLANGAPDPLTVPELRVNQQAASDKYSSNPTVSADLDGNLLVAWQRHNGGGFQPKVFGRRFDAGLAGLDPPASINCGTFAHGQEFCIDLVAGFHPQSDLEPDARGDGRFVITATQLHLSKHRIIARAFDFADGEPLDDLFSATDEPTINHWRSEVAVDHDGGWIIAWQRTPSGDLSTRDYEVRAKRYDENGDSVTPQFPVVGDQFQVNDFTAEDQVAPSIAVSATGDFTISWLSRQDTAFSLGCYAKRYTRDAVEVPPPCEAWVGTAIGNEFQVNTLIAGDQYQLRVSSDPLGDLNFGWAGWDPSTSGSEAWVRRLDREGLPR